MPTTATARERARRFFTGATNTPEEIYQEAVRLHKTLYWIGVPSLILVIVIDVMMSYAGAPLIIAIVNMAIMLVLGFYMSTPATFLTMFGAGAGWKLVGYNWSWRNIFLDEAVVFPDIQISEIAKQGWQACVSALKLPAHFLIVAIATGTVLELWQVNHPTAALVFFPALAGIGMWSFALGGATKWYRRITIAVLVIGALASFHQVFAEEKPRPLNNIVSDLTYSKTVEFEVKSLQPQKLGGIKPGRRKFSIPEKQYIRINGEDQDITSYVRMNGTPPNESLEVESTGKVEVSYALPKEVLEKTIDPQTLRANFR